MSDKFISLQEAASLKGLTVLSFRYWIMQGLIKPVGKIGMNYIFDRDEVLRLNTSELKKGHYVYNLKKRRKIIKKRYELKPLTREDLKLLEDDLAEKLDRTEKAKELKVSRQRLVNNIHSIAYRKMYFERMKK